MSEAAYSEFDPDRMIDEPLPYYLTEPFWKELVNICRRIRQMMRVRDRATNTVGISMPGALLDYDGLWQCADDCRTLGVGQVLAELATEGTPRRQRILERLDNIHMACDFELPRAKNADERDAIETLRTYCYNLRLDLGRRFE